MISEANLAWCAGLFDGEGNFGICKHTRTSVTYSISAQVHLTHEEGLRTFKERIGFGNLRLEKLTNPKHKQCYKWYIHGKPAADVARMLLQYLIIKKPQAELMIEFDEKWRRRKSNDEPLSEDEERILRIICSEMADLNKRGAL